MFCKSIIFTACSSLFFYPRKKTLTDNNQEKEIRALLIGKTGVGKSYLGNLILGKECFSPSADNQTRTTGFNICSNNIEYADEKYKLTIIDTQGLFDQTYNSLNLLDNIIQKIKDVKGIHKIIYVAQYDSILESLSLIILGALSYCILGTSHDLLVIVNKAGRGVKYMNQEQINQFSQEENFIYQDFILNKEDKQMMKNLQFWEEKIKEWWGRAFIFQNVKNFQTCQNQEEEKKDKEECRSLLLSDIITCRFIRPNEVRTWSEFYKKSLEKNGLIKNKNEQIAKLKQQMKENKSQKDKWSNILGDITKHFVWQPAQKLVNEGIYLLLNWWFVSKSDQQMLEKLEKEINDYIMGWKKNKNVEEEEKKINKINSILENL